MRQGEGRGQDYEGHCPLVTEYGRTDPALIWVITLSSGGPGIRFG
jgi:hypothetical protein